MDQRAESPEEAACRKEEEERRARERQEEEEAKCLEKFEGAEPLEAAELLAFTDSMLPGCSQLLDELPDTVYRVCDLIMTAIKRNGAAYRDSVLKQVVKQVWEAADVLIKAALPLTTSGHQNRVRVDQPNGHFASSFQLGHSDPSAHPPL
ncbi:E3 ubiquitin-protein ligase HUWE1-like [Guaruba guarouba]